MAKKKTDCKSCDDLTARLEAMEQRLDKQEASAEHWRKRWGRMSDELGEANGKISLLEKENSELKVVVEKKDAQIKGLQKKLFAPSAESTLPSESSIEQWEEAPPKRPRGKQPAAKGHGRKIRDNLPVEEVVHDVTPEQKHCQSCGLEREPSPFFETSEEIHYTYKLVRIRHKRRKYKKACSCKSVPTFVTAPAPDKLVPKGLFSTGFWTYILLEKFWLQRPLSRICSSLALQGLEVSDGSLASSMKRLPKLFAPLYNSIRKRAREATHWQMDETHWRVFTDLMGKSNHKWWLWVTETDDTTLFTLDPSRSSNVPMRLLKDIEHGLLTCDRYSAYKPLEKQGILLSYCWSHVRRDYIKLRDGYPKLKRTANKWIEKIDSLFHCHREGSSSSEFGNELRNICELMNQDAQRVLKRKDVHPELRSTLESLLRHWNGLTLFLLHEKLPLDNNASERALRNPVVGRKNYYGNRAIWSGHLAAMLFSIFATLSKHKINHRQYMLDYLTACAQNRGSPPIDIEPFLPWNYSKNSLNQCASMVY